MPPDAPPAGDPGAQTLLTPAAPAPPAAPVPAGDQSAPPVVPDSTPAAAPDWKESLPEIFRTDPSLRVFEGHADQATMLEALGKAYRDTKSMVGRRLEMPGPDATPEQIAAFRKVTGAPENPDGYGSLRPETFPAELWDAESEKQFAALAHKHHLPPGAVKEIAALHGQLMQAGLDGSVVAQEQMLAAEKTKLEQAWGGEFGKNIAAAERFAATVGLKSDNPVFSSAEVVQAFARAASLISEDKLVAGAASPATSGNAARAAEIMDPRGTSMLARQYRGEFGQAQQMQAAETLTNILKATA